MIAWFLVLMDWLRQWTGNEVELEGCRAGDDYAERVCFVILLFRTLTSLFLLYYARWCIA